MADRVTSALRGPNAVAVIRVVTISGPGQIRVYPPSLVFETQSYSAVADFEFAGMPIHRPTLVWPWIRLIEDRLEDCPFGRSLGDRICHEIVRDLDLSSPARRHLRHDEREQNKYPQN